MEESKSAMRTPSRSTRWTRSTGARLNKINREAKLVLKVHHEVEAQARKRPGWRHPQQNGHIQVAGRAGFTPRVAAKNVHRRHLIGMTSKMTSQGGFEFGLHCLERLTGPLVAHQPGVQPCPARCPVPTRQQVDVTHAARQVVCLWRDACFSARTPASKSACPLHQRHIIKVR